MANTTNYNWETPDDTDLVKDGAAAIRTLGSSIDTTTKALNPETTLGDIAYRSATSNTNTRLAIGSAGQVLTVAAGVPSWATPTTGDIEGVTAGTGISGGGTSGTVTITNSMATAIDAKGDLVVGTGADTFSRLAVGTNTYILTADSAEATGLKWAAPASGSTFAGCGLTKSAAQAVANATTVFLTFDTEEFDSDAYHSTSSNTSRITIPSGKGGKYLFVLNVNFAGNATGQRLLMLYKNGAVHKYSTSIGSAAGYSFRVTTSVIASAVATDYFEFAVYQDSGVSLDVNGGATETTFSTTYLGA
jgi:hypothetical protein